METSEATLPPAHGRRDAGPRRRADRDDAHRLRGDGADGRLLPAGRLAPRHGGRVRGRRQAEHLVAERPPRRRGHRRRHRRLLDRPPRRARALPPAEVAPLQPRAPAPRPRLLREARRQDDHPRALHADRPDVRPGRRRNGRDGVPAIRFVQRDRRISLGRLDDSDRLLPRPLRLGAQEHRARNPGRGLSLHPARDHRVRARVAEEGDASWSAGARPAAGPRRGDPRRDTRTRKTGASGAPADSQPRETSSQEPGHVGGVRTIVLGHPPRDVQRRGGRRRPGRRPASSLPPGQTGESRRCAAGLGRTPRAGSRHRATGSRARGRRGRRRSWTGRAPPPTGCAGSAPKTPPVRGRRGARRSRRRRSHPGRGGIGPGSGAGPFRGPRHQQRGRFEGQQQGLELAAVHHVLPSILYAGPGEKVSREVGRRVARSAPLCLFRSFRIPSRHGDRSDSRLSSGPHLASGRNAPVRTP